GLQRLKVTKTRLKLIVESSVKHVRGHISAFVAKGKKIDQYLLGQLIQFQEKLSEVFGRKRQKLAIGLYPCKKILFPIRYKAVAPNTVKFVPLGMRAELSLSEILQKHSKGREYGWILEGQKKVPILVDSKRDVLSFPPIINSELTGRLGPGDSELFFEATGTDAATVSCAANIFAHALADRGFSIEAVTVMSGGKTFQSPDDKTARIKFDSALLTSILGTSFSEAELKPLFARAQLGYSSGIVEVPSYRQDVMHPVDIVEDIAIVYGYEKFKPIQLKSYTIGKPLPILHIIDKFRTLALGAGYQEVFSPILTSKEVLLDKMELKLSDVIEISNPASHTYSTVRSWLLPSLIEFLSKNKNVEYPQKVFEQGTVVRLVGGKAIESESFALASCHSEADFTEIKQILEWMMRLTGLVYRLEESNHPSFIQGRQAKLLVNGTEVGFFGELHPAVLSNWGLELPVAAAELSLTAIRNLSK
ncbi:MAG: phenylalanine--tRNA ligase subunit beta, partial [Candidatus Woesearchaeota archaeon]